MRRLLTIGFVSLMMFGRSVGQTSISDDRDNKYIPRNLPDVILTEKEAKRKRVSKGSAKYSYVKYSVSLDPFFVAWLLGPYLKFDWSLGGVTLFAGLGYSPPGGLIYSGDPVTYFIPFNTVIAAQDEDYTLYMLEESMVNNRHSFAFEGGIIFSGLPDVLSKTSFALFLRYARGGGYRSITDEIWNPNIFDYETITTIVQYDAQLIEVAGVLRKPWGRINIVPGEMLLYFTTDYGLGLGALKVNRKEGNKSPTTNTSFVIDIIWRFYMGIAF